MFIREETQSKDKSISVFQKKIKDLEESINDKNVKIDFLERIKQEFRANEQNMEKTVDVKQQLYDELNREFRCLKSDHEKQTTILNNTFNDRTH